MVSVAELPAPRDIDAAESGNDLGFLPMFFGQLINN